MIRLLVACLLLVALGPAQHRVIDADELARLLGGRTATCPRPLPFATAPVRSWTRPGVPGPGVDSVIRDDFPCNDDVTGGCRQNGPAIAADEQGNFVIAWYGFSGGDTDVRFRLYDSSGAPLGENQLINTDYAMRWQSDPAAAMRSDGSFLFSWEDRRAFGNSDIFSQRYAPDGERLGDNFRVSDSGVPGDQIISGVHVAPNGVSLLAWDDRRFGITGDIFAQFLNPDGSPLDTNFRVNDDPLGMANQYEPHVRGDDSGRFVVVWMDGRGHNAYDWNIFAQRFDASGSRLGSNLQVTVDDSIQWAPGIGVAPSGRFIACWDDRRRSQWDVYAQVYDAAGEQVGDNFRVSTDPGSVDQFSSTAAGNRYDEFLVIWTDRRSGEDIYARRFDAAGQPLGDEFLLNDESGGVGRGEPTAIARPDGGYWVAWVDGRKGDLDVYAQRVARSGQLVGANFRVNSDTASSLQRVSSIDMDARGTCIVAWEDERGADTDIYRVLFDSTGTRVGANLRVNDDGPGSSQYYAAAAAGNGRYFVTWTDFRNDFNIYGQFMDRDGNPVGANFPVNSETGGIKWYSYCAMDDSNRAIAVWMDTRSTDGYKIRARRFDPDGNPVGPDFHVGEEGVTQVYASVAVNPGGRHLVSWMDYRDGSGAKPSIYCQLFAPDGSRIGTNVRVNDDAGEHYQGYPVGAVADDGSFAVVWEETRNDGYDVYLQWFDSTGARVGGNIGVDNSPADCYSPTCDFDSHGRLAVLFNDEREREGSPQIYCQRFRADRSRISGNQRLSNPDLFPGNHHWTVGRSIAVSDRLVAAAWTDNRRSQGWDIYAKLTDWNLVGIAELPASPKAGLRVLPTVTGGRVRLQTPGMEFPGCVTLYDLAGREVLRRQVQPGLVDLDIAHLPSGVYHVHVTDGETVLHTRLVLR